jgi:hypothetical protein
MRFNPNPPYNVLATNTLDFATVQRLGRFARYWDMIVNSGRFTHTRPFILGSDSFNGFLAFSDWLFKKTGQTHRIALRRLYQLIYEGLAIRGENPPEAIAEALIADHQKSGLKGYLDHDTLRQANQVGEQNLLTSRVKIARRQARH